MSCHDSYLIGPRKADFHFIQPFLVVKMKMRTFELLLLFSSFLRVGHILSKRLSILGPTNNFLTPLFFLHDFFGGHYFERKCFPLLSAFTYYYFFMSNWYHSINISFDAQIVQDLATVNPIILIPVTFWQVSLIFETSLLSYITWLLLLTFYSPILV